MSKINKQIKYHKHLIFGIEKRWNDKERFALKYL